MQYILNWIQMIAIGGLISTVVSLANHVDTITYELAASNAKFAATLSIQNDQKPSPLLQAQIDQFKGKADYLCKMVFVSTLLVPGRQGKCFDYVKRASDELNAQEVR